MKLATAQLETEARRLLGASYRDLPPEQRRVVLQIVRRGPIARNLADPDPSRATFAGRAAEAAARVCGSWGFVAILVAGAAVGGAALLRAGHSGLDPYPYLILDLATALLAALQASVLLMALNRSSRREREAAAHTYEIHLKTELEIMALHDKVEALRTRELADLLAHQVELLQEMRDRPRSTAA